MLYEICNFSGLKAIEVSRSGILNLYQELPCQICICWAW